MRLIYLASPYTHDSALVRESRYSEACRTVAAVWKSNQHINIFSPIVHNHCIAVVDDLPLDFAYWRAMDIDMLRRCDELWVLMIDGWDRSAGITAEVAAAVAIGLPVMYVRLTKNGIVI